MARMKTVSGTGSAMRSRRREKSGRDALETLVLVPPMNIWCCITRGFREIPPGKFLLPALGNPGRSGWSAAGENTSGEMLRQIDASQIGVRHGISTADCSYIFISLFHWKYL